MVPEVGDSSAPTMWSSVLLPDPDGTHDRDHLALFDRQVDAVQSAHLGAALPVVHVQAVRLDSCCGHEVQATADRRVGHPCTTRHRHP